MTSPSAVMRNTFSPTSMPVSLPVRGSGSVARWLGGHLRAGEGGVPPIRLLGDGDRLGGAFYGTVQSEGDTANLGEAEHPAVQDGAVPVFREREGVVAVSPGEAGKRGNPGVSPFLTRRKKAA